MNLALVDNNAAHLALAKESLSQQTDTTEGATEGDKSTITETYEMDVGDLAKWEELRESVRGRFPEGRVDLLVLNAGMSRKGGWENAGYFREVGSAFLLVGVWWWWVLLLERAMMERSERASRSESLVEAW